MHLKNIAQKKKRVATFVIACIAMIMGCGCQQQEETDLRLQLSSSLQLSNYDSIEVALVDTGRDTSTVLQRLFIGSFSNMPASWPLPANLSDGQFAVRVRAYEYEGQLALQVYLVKQNSQQLTTVSTLPTASPYSLALQSIAAFSAVTTPAFDTSAADTNYQIAFSSNTDTAQITPISVDSRAQLFIDHSASPFGSGDTLKVLLDSGATVPVQIALLNHGITRRYHLSLSKTSTIP